MRIAVYSGSFNPLHEGHVAILRRLSGMFDFTYLIVSPQNPFKGSEYLLSARDRFNAADGMLHRHPELSARADDIEFSMPAPQYSIRTLDALRDREPGNSFTLVIGADNLPRFNEWKDYRRILVEYGVVVFPRNGIDMPSWKEKLLADVPDGHIQLADAPEVNISSTQIREAAGGRN